MLNAKSQEINNSTFMMVGHKKLFTALEDILYFYDEAMVAKQFDLTRDEFLFLYGASIGYDMAKLMDYLDRQQSAIYALRRKIIRKFNVSTFEQVMFCFGQMEQDG